MYANVMTVNVKELSACVTGDIVTVVIIFSSNFNSFNLFIRRGALTGGIVVQNNAAKAAELIKAYELLAQLSDEKVVCVCVLAGSSDGLLLL